jgi:hypothetical protein
MAPTTYTCDAKCPNVTRTHMSRVAVQECRTLREAGAAQRSSVLSPKLETPFDITLTSGDDYHDMMVREDLSMTMKWRPNFVGASLEMDAYNIEGAHLPGADFRQVHSSEFVADLPVYMMTESRGAIVDDHHVEDATIGSRAWLLSAPESTPETESARLALDFAVPFLQWSFTHSQWEQLVAEGYDPDELVEAAQEFPPRNEPGFRAFMDTGDYTRAQSMHPHERSWGDRELTLPPQSNARRRQAKALRSMGPSPLSA